MSKKRCQLFQSLGGYAIFDNYLHLWLVPDDIDILPKMRAYRIVRFLEAEPNTTVLFRWQRPAVAS